ncbi:MAG TPA: hypothetical protein VK923_18410 [Euzebyales bacterium]|nr:hypothetical protein [Euzebyales bacterium]
MFAEPSYAREVDWLQCDGRARLMADDGESLSLRLSTRPLDQDPVRRAIERAGEDALRAAVLAGAYHLIEPRTGALPSI